jgi:TATA-box binding protein (TBP) (component of TFIID and TFIIIB)
VSTSIDLARFFNTVPIADAGTSGYTYVEMASKSMDMAWRGERPASAIASAARRATRKKQSDVFAQMNEAGVITPATPPFSGRHFDNQVTVLFRLVPANVTMNIKVFKNGKVQLTGVKRKEQGEEAVRHLVCALREMDAATPGVVLDARLLEATGYRVCLINSDFHLGFELTRDKLFGCLRNAYDTVCTYEPCIYPGVKIQYMWNTLPMTSHEGVCCCTEPCSGKGDGMGDGKCRKITIAVFQSGSVIITGAHTLTQIDDAYRFIVGNVASTHFVEIRRPAARTPTAAPPPRMTTA